MFIYMVLVLVDYRGAFDNFVGTTFVQPVIGSMASFLTVGVCILIGLPIRLNRKIYEWWTNKMWIPISGAVIGLVMIILSFLPSMLTTVTTTINDEVVQRQVPYIGFILTGWLLIGFSLVHIFPTYSLRNLAKKFLRTIFRTS